MKRVAFAIITILIPVCLLEIGCILIAKYFKYEYFSIEKEYMEEVNREDFSRFVTSAYFDRRIGWNNPTLPTKTSRKNCVGEAVEYNYQDGARVTPTLPRGKEKVAIFGESFAQGEEVGDEFTVSSVLTRQHHIPAINYGVNAYDPLQAVEKFRAIIAAKRTFKIAVLLVMHENIWRVVNSFKPVYYPYGSAYRFGLKPYVKNGKIVPLVFPMDYQDFLIEARTRIREDYWSKPDRQFPYSVSLIRVLFSKPFTARFWARVKGPFVDEYDFNAETRSGLAVVLDEFVSAADSAGIRPIIVFIPRNEKTYKISQNFVRSMNDNWKRVIAHEFIDDNMDWGAYKISNSESYCHPSAYGYGRIAAFVGNVTGRAVE